MGKRSVAAWISPDPSRVLPEAPSTPPEEPKRNASLAVTAIIIAESRWLDLAACLRELLQEHSFLKEVLLVLIAPTGEVRHVAQGAATADSRVRILESPRISPSVARNTAAQSARGDVLYFLDDDVLPRATGLRALCLYLVEHPEVMIAGGANLTPADDPRFSQLSGQVLATVWGAGIVRKRYLCSPSHVGAAHDLVTCNLAVRREVFESGVRFPEDFQGEELVLLARARRRGYLVGYVEDAFVYHRRRQTFWEHGRQIARYGEGRARAMAAEPRVGQLWFLLPSAFLVYLAALPLLATLSLFWLVPLGLYSLLTLWAALMLTLKNKRLDALPLATLLFSTTHLCYGWGVLRGLLKLPFRGLRRSFSRPSSSAIDARSGSEALAGSACADDPAHGERLERVVGFLRRIGMLALAAEVNVLVHRLAFLLAGRLRIARYLRRAAAPRLHLGCGRHRLRGWLNADRCPLPFSSTVAIDARKKLPIRSESLDHVYSEHLIEHLSYRDGLFMLKEVHRTLRPGGVVRIATPDLDFLLALHSEEKSELQERYVAWSAETFVEEPGEKGDCFVINNFFRSWGHRFIYDESTLRRVLTLAGFAAIKRCRISESEHELLNGLENTRRLPQGFLELETLILEATK